MPEERAILIVDTSVLVNFLAIGRGDLLARLGYRIIITDHVSAEVADHYPEQQAALRDAIAKGHVEQVALTAVAELSDFAALVSRNSSRRKRLGAGECSAMVMAVHWGYELAIEDKPAIKQIREMYPQIRLLRTQDLMIRLIQTGALGVPDADQIKKDWAANHRFQLSEFGSFAELL